jgi:hypothetical protein
MNIIVNTGRHGSASTYSNRELGVFLWMMNSLTTNILEVFDAT